MITLESDRFGKEPTLIDALLDEQQRLTAVEKFTQRHETSDRPQQARYYRELLPAKTPGAGQQYAFEVDLDQCSGCKACVTACHNLNGLDEDETWRSVGLLHGGTSEQPVQQTITTACHHCIDPACLHGCPVNAYEKDAATGIVRHLDDQCIGCQYCLWKCPYQVPQYHARKGIVRKCDLCSNRLVAGEAPACVQACPNKAIRITLIDQERITLGLTVQIQTANPFLPGSPDPGYTLPTTRYKTKNPLPANMTPGDLHDFKPQCAHPSLAIMLVLAQLSVGTFCLDLLLGPVAGPSLTALLRPILSLVAWAIGLAGISASLFHLGRPWFAWRAFVGLKRSWLSREIVAFGTFMLLAALYTASNWFGALRFSSRAFEAGLGLAVTATGLAGVFCSVMVYHDTRRIFWQAAYTAPKFFGTSLLLAVASALCLIVSVNFRAKAPPADPALVTAVQALCVLLIVSASAKLACASPLVGWRSSTVRKCGTASAYLPW